MRLAVLACAACGRIGFDAGDGGDGSSVDAASPIVASVEAEAGTIVAPFAIAQDAAASGGLYVIDGNTAGIGGAGSDTLGFALAADGTYYVWGRTLAIDTSTDSFFVSIDGSAAVGWDTSDCLHGPVWHWAGLREPYTCTGAPLPALRAFALTAGAHDLVLTSREGQSKVDRVVITSDPAYVPSG